jgi:hypothetical protein
MENLEEILKTLAKRLKKFDTSNHYENGASKFRENRICLSKRDDLQKEMGGSLSGPRIRMISIE